MGADGALKAAVAGNAGSCGTEYKTVYELDSVLILIALPLWTTLLTATAGAFIRKAALFGVVLAQAACVLFPHLLYPLCKHRLRIIS